MSVLVEFSDVCKNFGNKPLIDKVSFTIEKGNLTTLIGPNGAGKTTIARLMLGLEELSSGKITTDSGLRIGYVPQKLNFSSTLPITIGHFLNLLAPSVRLDQYKEFSNFIDLSSLNHKDDIYSLSGGQFQKLFIAATLLNKPDLILLDEPLQSLDVASQQEFYYLIEHVKQNLGISVFMISHDLFTVMKNSDQVICLNGHICCSGKPNDLSKNQDFINTLSAIGFYSHHHDHTH